MNAAAAIADPRLRQAGGQRVCRARDYVPCGRTRPRDHPVFLERSLPFAVGI